MLFRSLAAAGIGRWPDCAALPGGTGDGSGLLAAVGYETVDIEKTVMAFQRHFRPSLVDGTMDADTLGRLRMLAAESDGKE